MFCRRQIPQWRLKHDLTMTLLVNCYKDFAEIIVATQLPF